MVDWCILIKFNFIKTKRKNNMLFDLSIEMKFVLIAEDDIFLIQD